MWTDRDYGDRERFALALLDRAIGLGSFDPAMRADLLDTAMLRPLGFITASLGFLMMSGVAFHLLHSPWAETWLCADLALLTIRLLPSIRPWREGRRVTGGIARTILAVASVMFVIFGAGCTASFATGVVELQIASVVAVMGLLTGLATRWAGLPRLALSMILAVSLPMGLAVAGRYPLPGALFAILAAGTAVLTLQNNHVLVAMLRAEREARRLATTDALTGLLNRAGLVGFLEQRRGDRATLIYVDLDGFKLVNDVHGHAAGDAVLKEIGRRLRLICGSAPVARLGGDEFVAVVAGDPASAAAASTALRCAIEQPIALDATGTLVRVGASCGSAYGILGSEATGDLLAEADHALYEAKRASSPGRHLSPRLACAGLA